MVKTLKVIVLATSIHTKNIENFNGLYGASRVVLLTSKKQRQVAFF